MKYIFIFALTISSCALFGQVSKGAFRINRNDTTHYILKLSDDKQFVIDSVTSVSTGRRLDFYDENTKGRACSSIVCTNPEDVTISFRELRTLNSSQDQKRTALNSHTQPTSDYQKGVIVYTRHGKTFKRIAINTFMETAPGDPYLTPSVPRGPAISGDR
jgi:hypothetical protein